MNCSPVGLLVQVAEFRLIQELCINMNIINIIKDDQFLNPEVHYGGKGNWQMIQRSEKYSRSSNQLSIITI